MRLQVLAAFAALSLVSLAACGGRNAAIVPTDDAPMAQVLPLTSKTVVTALYKGKPLPNLLVTLKKCQKPCEYPPKFLGKLSAGKTGAKGRVGLHGNWTKDTFVCAVGSYKNYDVTDCRLPFPAKVTLYFE